jgi:YggT family protein
MSGAPPGAGPTMTDSFLTHWYFHLPNLAMAALIYTLIGRYALSLFFKPDSQAVILVVFKSITDPVLKAVRAMTPKVVPNGLIIVFAIVWLMAARMFWFLTCVAAGMKAGVAAG